MSQMSLEGILDLIGGACLTVITGGFVALAAYDIYNKRYEIREGIQELYSQVSELFFPKTPNQEIFENYHNH